MAVVFIAQSTLQQWADQGKVRLEETTLLLLKEQRQVALRPAVRFTQILGSESDPNGLVGKVKTTAQLAELGAEHYMDSVLLGEVAYTVVEGFLGDMMASTPVGQAPPAAPVALGSKTKEVPAAVQGVEAKAAATVDDDAAQLSKLFLDTVH